MEFSNLINSLLTYIEMDTEKRRLNYLIVSTNLQQQVTDNT